MIGSMCAATPYLMGFALILMAFSCSNGANVQKCQNQVSDNELVV